MKIIKTNNGYIIEHEKDDTVEQIMVMAIKLFMEGLKNESLEIRN